MKKETLENIKRATWDDNWEEHKDNSNLYLGIALGVMIVACGVIYVIASVANLAY
jgi:hypothetical protein